MPSLRTRGNKVAVGDAIQKRDGIPLVCFVVGNYVAASSQ
jgi:hypothetical protein